MGRDEDYTGWGCQGAGVGDLQEECLTADRGSDPASCCDTGEGEATAVATNYLFTSSLPGLLLGPRSASSRKTQTPVLPQRASRNPAHSSPLICPEYLGWTE